MRHEREPGPTRFLVLSLAAALIGGALWSMPLGTPPASPSRLLDWWAATGTARASIAIVRLSGIVVAVWLGLSTLSGAAAGATRSAAMVDLWSHTLPRSWRRALVSTSIVATVATANSGPAGAADSPADPDPVLTDIGRATDDGGTAGPLPVLRDLGPAATALVAQVPPDDENAGFPEGSTADTPEEWVVARGDHLWHIAAETLRDRGVESGDAEVAVYWQRLIDANRAVLGDDPDLIHPGSVLTLPG